MMRDAPRGTLMQVAHVVRNIPSAVPRWVEGFGAGPFFVAPFRFDDHMFRGQRVSTNMTAAIGCLGSTIIELAQPNDALPSIFNEVLLERGEGLHHYWLKSDDLNVEIARYQQAGCELIGYGDMPGVGRGAYIDTSKQLGCFVELLELTPKIWDILDFVRDAHQRWDGRDAIRPYPSF